MTWLRALLIVLVLANVVYFAWAHGALAAFGAVPSALTEREPQRMAQQVRPTAVVIKPATAGPAQSAR